MANNTNLRVKVQRVGSSLSNMVLPNLGAFIAWGLLTAIAVPTGIKLFSDFVDPMLHYLLPLLIAFTGGKMVYEFRGGVVGAVATMGVIVAADIPMFIGAMVMGPLGGLAIKKVDQLLQKKTPTGFELLINNFSAGITGALLALIGSLLVGPVVVLLTSFLEAGVDLMIKIHALPLVSIFIEPAKILFLNNAISQGILAPIATGQVAEQGKSMLFLLEANPGPGLGVLLAYMFFGKGSSKTSAYGASIIHFFGGIHEIYFPYILMKPKLLIATILGGMSGITILMLFDAGLVSIASPGSIIPIMLLTASDSYLGVILSVLVATIVSFVIAGLLLKFDKSNTNDLSEATKEMEQMKGKKSRATQFLTSDESAEEPSLNNVNHILFACDAGMGSSAMGASIVRKKLKKANLENIDVSNVAISNLPQEGEIIITHKDLTERAREKQPEAYHISIENYMNTPEYDNLIEKLSEQEKNNNEDE
ncbi:MULTISPECIES: PTS mannitol transporter subunit IICB [unclassified Mammaliicoccus]|uniref:PTS mannitol transporter subunit IICB n=1 Tax=unclassified Mammaliicoccus TaxID=2803851 RepID=UPI001EFBFB07|nr:MULTISPECIES: PTS mannitol transporter subunit IICB [unclassified Mammaliicoccus]